jgi:predicted deacylase
MNNSMQRRKGAKAQAKTDRIASVLAPLRLCVQTVLLILFATHSPAGAIAQERPSVTEIQIGVSAQGRPITGIRIGNGPRKLALIGDTHGLPEANTFELTRQLLEYFRANPQQVPASVRLYIIPTINPDGLALGTRFNSRGVDLNRNMNTNLDACSENDWQVTVQGARGIVSDTGGSSADSEPESQLVRDFLLDASGVIFYHSNAGNVFPAFCEHSPSITLAQVYADAASYSYSRYWDRYTITGGMHDWAASLGIAAIIPELISPVDPEYDQNLAAVLALLARAEELLPVPGANPQDGFSVHPIIWRYWKMHGGTEQFGPPIAAPKAQGATIQQAFRNAILEYRPDQADTPYLVQLLPLGRLATPDATAQVLPLPAEAQYFPETGYRLFGAFASFWAQGGLNMYGYPLSNEYIGIAPDNTRRPMQIFERVVMIYYAEDQSVRLAPLGWAALVREHATAGTTAHQIR